jgi:nucleoside-diphosphate-sugar epimerase
MRFNLKKFISESTGRSQSFFAKDIEDNSKLLSERIDGKKILVIGGAGTIGSSYIRAILKFKPSKVVVIDIDENGLTELVRDVRSTEGLHVPEEFITYPINFSDSIFEKIFKHHGPFQIVANFAAHKHVRSEKDQFSIEAMIKNNVINAKVLLDLLMENKPERFFCVSTDKAANPVNVMGGSKKLMEEVIIAYSKHMPITTARFANVAFSNGSLLFGFIERMTKQQPFSGPSNIKRYFVSPEESGQLCMLACMLGESGSIFFPKLDPEKDMQTFETIGVNLLKAHNWEVDYCKDEDEAKEKANKLNAESTHYPVYFFQSDTSGEKPYEEFFTESEEKIMNQYQALGYVKNAPAQDLAFINNMFVEFNNLFNNELANKESIISLMKKYIPNFDHIEKGKNLDQRM